MIRIPLLCFLLVSAAAQAQFTYVMEQNVPVQDADGNTLAMPWAGGLNATQYNTLDLNQDSQIDLVLFDRMANKAVTFLRQNDRFEYAPEYELFFPTDLLNWMLLRDFNCDGKKDLFTGDTGGMRVYKNTTADGATPSWEQVFFYTGFSGPKSEVLLTKGFNQTKINLQLQFDDLPSITDADGDGDLDIFNMQFGDDGNIEFHQNMSRENNFNCDSLEFVRYSPREWGDVKECSCGSFAFHGEDCASGGRIKHAGGKSLLALDVNRDQQVDLLFSEATCAQLFQLPNEGTLLTPEINTFAAFPPSTPNINPVLYPAPYFEDVDGDGVKDLMVSSNIFAKPAGFLNLDLARSNRFYRNSGSDVAPVFDYVQNDFLQADMIDVGDNAVPAFADFDGDGDQDLFISRGSTPQFVSTIVLYENTGNASNPSFKLRTNDYLNFSFVSFYNIKLQFADIDGNNTHDLVFTATDFNSGATLLYYVSNKSQTAHDFSGQFLIQANFSLSFNENLCITDVDSDGRADILAGRNDGSLEYWKNNSTGSTLMFSLEDESFAGLDASVLRLNIACTIADLDADGSADLIYGDQTGVLKILPDYRNAANDSGVRTDLVYNPLLKSHGAQNLGGRIWPVSANLFNSVKPALVVGNILGGVHILKNENQFSLYPNPVAKEDPLQIEVDEPTTLYIFSITGARSAEPIMLEGNEVVSLKLPFLARGLYVLRFVSATKTITKKIMIK
jgi:hypothetical protein